MAQQGASRAPKTRRVPPKTLRPTAGSPGIPGASGDPVRLA